MGSEYVTGEEAMSGTDEEGIPIVLSESNPFWKQNAEKLVGESISSVEDTAKQFVTVTGLLEGIYYYGSAEGHEYPDL
jgi:myo-inositol-hexaphosphate 3-phosphohydrolase